jgi:hypothetical protein
MKAESFLVTLSITFAFIAVLLFVTSETAGLALGMQIQSYFTLLICASIATLIVGVVSRSRNHK